MNTIFKSALLGLALSTQAFAIEPSNGWYVGGFAGISFSPSVDFTILNPFTTARIPGQISYDPLADGGINLGYRCSNFRFEGELVYNQNRYNKLRINQSYVPQLTDTQAGLAFKGNTQVFAGLFNVYYDLFYEDSDSNMVPYFGIGLGYGEVSNQLNFYFNQFQFIQDKENTALMVGQAILGLDYFFNEDWSLGADIRYLSSKKIEPYNHRAAFGAINLVLNYTFDEP